MASIRDIKIGSTTYDIKSTHYATCSTASGTAAKAATIQNGNFTLETGARVAVKFTAANNVTSATLNVNSTGAKTIRWRNANLASTQYWTANQIVDFIYDGTYWVVNGAIKDNNTTYSAVSSTANGLMSSGDKAKLDGIASGANKYTLPNATSTSLGGVKVGSNITVSSGTISLTKANVTAALGYTPISTAYTLPNATSTTLGGVKVGNNITVSSGTISLTKANVTAALGYTPPQSDTNTTYTAGTGVTLSGTVFKVTSSDLCESLALLAPGTANVDSEAYIITAHSTNSSSTLYFNRPAKYIVNSTLVKDALGVADGGTTFLKKDGTWATPTNTDTKVEQKAAITTSGAFPVILACSTATTASTSYVNKTTNLTFNPGTKMLSTYGLTISNTSAGQIKFSRESGNNYITIPTSANLAICFNPSLTTADSVLMVNSASVYPGSNGSYSLGTNTSKWSALHTYYTYMYNMAYIHHTNYSKGTAPTTTKERMISFNDSDGTSSSTNRTGMIYNGITSANVNTMAMYAYNHTVNTTAKSARVYVQYSSEGVAKAGSNAAFYGAVWNDYAEFRDQSEEVPAGYCVTCDKDGKVYRTTERLQYCEGIVSDTFGFSIGETEQCKTPLAVSGRVLAFYGENREDYNIGDPVCAGPDGKIYRMTRDEVREYPERIVGTVSEIPSYEKWGDGEVPTEGRIWIKV